MNSDGSNPPIRTDPAALPRPKWWGHYVIAGDPPERRFVFHWGSILAVAGALCLALYLGGVSALWGYYSVKRGIPGIHWVDVALPARFPRVQGAIGAYYFGEAKNAWAKGDVVRAVVTARAAVIKAPSNLDARLFLAGCWRAAGRSNEAVIALREGIPFNAADTRLQAALVDTCINTNHYADLLSVLRIELPAKGVRLLDGTNKGLELAEVRAVLETAGSAEADRTAAGHPDLAADPDAAPLLARIDSDLGRKDQALRRLKEALDRAPTDAVIQDAYIQTAIDLKMDDEARAASERFLRASPSLLAAQLCFLETHDTRRGKDENQWITVTMEILAQNRHDPASLAKLGSLAGSKGWTDLTFLLYENSLQDNLIGFPFAIYYAASLIKSGDLASADSVLRELSIRNGPQTASAAYLSAMVDWGTGRESEAMQIVQQLRRETADDPHRRLTIEGLFRSFGYPRVADELIKGSS